MLYPPRLLDPHLSGITYIYLFIGLDRIEVTAVQGSWQYRGLLTMGTPSSGRDNVKVVTV